MTDDLLFCPEDTMQKIEDTVPPALYDGTLYYLTSFESVLR